MYSAEKPYENLSEHEQKIFSICAEVIAWNPGKAAGPEIMQLRERATALYEKLRHTDLTNDDSYYKYLTEADGMARELYELQEKFRSDEHLEATKVGLDGLEEKLLSDLNSGRDAAVYLDWEEPNQDSAHSDMTSIRIYKEGESAFTLQLGEIFDWHLFKGKKHIQTFIENLPQDILGESESGSHIHQINDHEEGPLEFWLTINNLSREKLETLLNQFIEIIRTNPRARNEEDL